MGQEKQIIKVLKVVQDGPAHSRDVSYETGLPVNVASAYLHKLWLAGLIERSGQIATTPQPPACNRKAWLYRIPGNQETEDR